MPSSTSKNDIRTQIRAKALQEGFDVVRIARAELPPQADVHLEMFLREGRHGDMDWMARTAERRANAKALWPEAESIVLLGINYGPRAGYHDKPVEPDRGAISVYAQGDDYHEVIKSKLKRLAGFIAETWGVDVKVFIDTAPVMEKPLAQAAGIGWQGKHTNLVSRLYGSWLFLGCVFTTLPVAADEPEVDHCGACRRCLDACPTNAFTAPYEIDARRCISYLTIEHKGHIPAEFREAMGNRIYGCDDCLAVCPWNKFASLSRELKLRARAELTQPKLSELVRLDEQTFREIFRGSPIKRIGRDRFIRNVLVAIGNSGEPALAIEATALLDDASPLVRAMAVWAAKRLLPEGDFACLKDQRSPTEPDEYVKAEWNA